MGESNDFLNAADWGPGPATRRSEIRRPVAGRALAGGQTPSKKTALWLQVPARVWTLFHGLVIVLKYMFKRPATIRYPEERRKLPIRSRGRHYLTKWEDGAERCVGCELCAIVCPSQAIYVKPAANDPEAPHSHGERYAKDFQINMLRCIFCGMCEEACPTGAIVLGNGYELSGYTRESLIYTKEMLTEKEPGESGRDPKREI